MARNRDRISNMPESILQFILSLVPLKSAVRTSILSRRWMNLWEYNLLSATFLDFSEEFAGSFRSAEAFVAAVDRYLQLHGTQKLESLHICFVHADIVFLLPNVERWIASAAKKGVQRLILDASQHEAGIKLPSTLHDCDTLTHLHLRYCDFCTPLDSKRFSCLRSLQLDHVGIDNNMLLRILIDCMFLKSLSLKNCECLDTVNISGDDIRLEKFTMVDCYGVCLPQIHAPKLRSLKLFGWLHFNYNFLNIPSVVDAFVSSIGREGFGRYVGMLTDLAHVKILTLCTSTLYQVATTEGVNPQAFPIHLQYLEELQLLIDVLNTYYLSCIFSFFRLCPCPILERLFVRFCSFLDTWIKPLKTPRGVIFNNLKTIKLINFRGLAHEMRLVRFLLKRAKSLIIVTPPPLDFKEGAYGRQASSSSQCNIKRRKLSSFPQLLILPKAYPNVRITVYDFFEDDSSLKPTHTEYYCECSLYSPYCR